MNDIVYLEQNKAVTDSLIIADMFDKQHFNVLRDIRNLDSSEKFNAINYELVKYKDKKGEERDYYRMTRDGFIFLVMGYTGKNAAQIKESYISAFNQMEKKLLEIASGHKLPNYKEALRELADSIEENERLKNWNKQLKNQVLEYKHKKQKYDEMISIPSTDDVSTAAKILGCKPYYLFELMRSKKITFYNKDGQNVPYQKYIDAGWFVIEKSKYERGGKKYTYPKIKITNKGIDKLKDIVNNDCNLLYLR